MKYYLILGLSILANVAANICIKTAMNNVGGVDISSLPEVWSKLILNYLVWLSLFLFGIAFVTYAYVLSHIQLSVAYPILTSLAFILVVLSSVLYLDETITIIQIFGISFIIVGVWMVAN